MKRVCLPAILLFLGTCGAAQTASPSPDAVIRPADNLVVENIPPIPASVAEKADQYGEFRAATLADWHPTRREMLIATRFADVPEIHLVKSPGGARSQLTFFRDRVSSARYQPKTGNYFVFSSDKGGGEWFQYYRFDLSTGAITLLTDGKSRNLGARFAHNGNRFVYTSTRRTGQDTDIWMMDASDPKSDRMLLQLQGGGWGPLDWSPDDRQFLLSEEVSANRSYLWTVDVSTGEKKLLTPKNDNEEIAYSGALFSKDGKGLYVTTDRDSEFQRLAYFDLASMRLTYLTTEIKWDVEDFDLSEDGKNIAFVTNEDGVSRLYLLDTASRNYRPIAGVPAGVIGEIKFHKNSRDLGFTLASAK